MALRILEAAVALVFPVVCAMKGKWGFVILGFALPVVWVIGAVRLAKPSSWWARRYYGDATMSESEQHFVLSRRERPPPVAG
jgi:hypothetical protein